MIWATDEFLRATLKMKDEEARRLRLVSEAHRLAGQDENGRAWRWRIEPGMEAAFRDLLGWLLSSQKDAPVETAPTAQVETASTAPVQTPSAAQGGSSVRDYCLPACCARAS